MTSVTATGSISTSSCLNCDKVFSLVDELTKSMQEFEIFTWEMTIDPKSAKETAREVLSNFWQLISTIKSLRIREKDQTFDNEKELCENRNSNQNASKSSFVVSGEKQEIESENEETKSSDEPAKSTSNSVDKMRTRRRQQTKLYPNPNVTPKRLNELKRAKSLLRTIKCKTGEGFYNLFECLKCQLQFGHFYSGLKHVQNIHMNLGTYCSYCGNIFFTKSSLELHMSKCSQKEQLKQIKVWCKNDKNKLVKVQLQPDKVKQKPAPSTRNSNRKRNQHSGKKTQNQRGKQRKTFDPLKIKVRNPFPNFNLENAVNVKVRIERINMENKKEASVISSIEQTRVSENFENDVRQETSSSEFIAPENQNLNTEEKEQQYNFT